MPLPDYQVDVISCVTGNVIAIYDMLNFDSLRYSRKVNDVGVFVLSMSYTPEYYAAFQWDNFVEIRRTHPVTNLLAVEETYFVRSLHHYREGNEERLVVGGLSLTHLLMRRIINPADDPAATDGYSVKTGAADTVMRDYIREQAGDLTSAARQFPAFTVEAVEGTGDTVSFSYRYDNLYNALSEIAYQSGIDFYLTRVTDNAISVFIERTGVDRTETTNEPFGLQWVGLSPLRGNLTEPSLMQDRTDEKNCVYCLGQGQGEERLVVEDFTDEVFLTPYNRIEYVKDARNVDKLDTVGLQTAADASLNENKANREFTFIPTGYDAGSIYRKDWDIADKITAIWEAEHQDLRIMGVEVNVDRGNEDVQVIIEEIYA